MIVEVFLRPQTSARTPKPPYGSTPQVLADPLPPLPPTDRIQQEFAYEHYNAELYMTTDDYLDKHLGWLAASVFGVLVQRFRFLLNETHKT